MKLSQYTAGIVRKSRREKEQEAADAKKREEEASAAQVYAEYVNAFEGEDIGRRSSGSAFVRAESNTAYAPSMSSSERRISRRSPSPSTTSAPKPKGKRAMDSFLEEIKKEQAEREAKYSRHSHGGHGRSVTAMAAYEGQSGSKDRGDPQTTNLFVANLPQHVTEPNLGKFFARAGPVGSVKIMWPRADLPPPPGSDSSRRSKGPILNGFVSFMNRRDAEDALREFDGYDWGGYVLRVGWSKAVPIASKPLYVSSNRIRDRGSRSRSRSRSRTPERHSGRNRDMRSRRSRSPSWDRHRSRSPRHRRSYSRSRRYSSSRSRSPRRNYSRSPQRTLPDEGEAVTDTFIRAVAFEVKGHDAKYEETLREREKANPKYNFLLQRDHRRHAYYKGLVESQEPFKPAFDDEGYNSVYSSDSAEESEREHTRKNALGPAARKRFEAMLRALAGKRGEIARCMTFCLEHGEAAHEVADIIVSSLLVDGTAVPRKVARLHLICDILHNSAASVPSAWKYRQEFQSRLGIVFDHLANIYHSFPGRITADLFKKQITTVVDIWEDWIVFPPDFTTELRTRLEGAVIPTNDIVDEEECIIQPPAAETFSSRFKTSSFQLAAPTEVVSAQASDGDGEPMDVSSDDDKGASDLDGEPVEDLDIDGVPMDDIDGVPIEVAGDQVEDDLDGQPIRDDVDGVPIDDDIDGLPLNETS
ncbi:Protein RRC1-like [Psilocybe cubensis]|nr:Protein RRC1-like [Psilocybe cubensis]KAH9485183.1 Protein RRC1-like [Psilocybe cubensis]